MDCNLKCELGRGMWVLCLCRFGRILGWAGRAELFDGEVEAGTQRREGKE